MAERLCQKRALETFQLDPEKWGGIPYSLVLYRVELYNEIKSSIASKHVLLSVHNIVN